jgi:Fic/DOC family protein
VPDWDEDSPRLRENLAQIRDEIIQSARNRKTPSLETARAWQRRFMEGLDVPNPKYVGAFRGEPGLERVQVRVERQLGVATDEVAEELGKFEAKLQRAVAWLDESLPPGRPLDSNLADAVIELCAWAHAEWVRIHPFANGNGRTARLWANSIALRYGLPPFVRLRPRPGGGYGTAGAQAMQGKWEPTADVFRRLLDDFLDEFKPGESRK